MRYISQVLNKTSNKFYHIITKNKTKSHPTYEIKMKNGRKSLKIADMTYYAYSQSVKISIWHTSKSNKSLFSVGCIIPLGDYKGLSQYLFNENDFDIINYINNKILKWVEKNYEFIDSKVFFIDDYPLIADLHLPFKTNIRNEIFTNNNEHIFNDLIEVYPNKYIKINEKDKRTIFI